MTENPVVPTAEFGGMFEVPGDRLRELRDIATAAQALVELVVTNQGDPLLVYLSPEEREAWERLQTAVDTMGAQALVDAMTRQHKPSV